MNRPRAIGLAAALTIAAIVTALWWRERQRAASARAARAVRPPGGAPAADLKPVATGKQSLRPPPPPVAAHGLSAEEKAARVEKIKRDYDDVRAKASADYSAAGAAFPGGLNAFLRQLTLLEREKRADFAAMLTPQELEDLELRDTAAGQTVERLLGGTSATDEQRRAVFRLQREFEDRFALTFDLTPSALLERETARQQLQEQIHAVLGDDLFGAWLRGEGEDYAQFVAFAQRQNLPANAALELRTAKNEFTLRRLELNTRTLTEQQRRVAYSALVQQTEARVLSIVGSVALQAGRKDLLSWLPRK